MNKGDVILCPVFSIANVPKTIVGQELVFELLTKNGHYFLRHRVSEEDLGQSYEEMLLKFRFSCTGLSVATFGHFWIQDVLLNEALQPIWEREKVLNLGVYEGAMCREEVREYVESSDCLILLGVFLSDVNLGIFTSHLDVGKSIYVTSEKVSIQYHTYEDVEMEDFVGAMTMANIRQREDADIPHPPSPQPPDPVSEKQITVRYLFQRLNSFLDDNTVVIADTGDAMFAAIDMTIHCATEFLSPAYYTSLGFAVPASLGVQLARPELRPLVLVGDGAFQMTGMELSSIARFHLNPIIVVLNNQGYGTERPMLDGRFNDIHLWNYSRIPEVLGAGKGYDIRTEGQLEKALQEVQKHTDSFCILDVHLDPEDRSLALERLTTALSKRIKQKD